MNRSSPHRFGDLFGEPARDLSEDLPEALPEDPFAEISRLRRLVLGALLGQLPEASTDFDRTRLDVAIFEEVIRIRKVVFQGLVAALRPKVSGIGTPSRTTDKRKAPPKAESGHQPEETALRVLEGLQLFVLQHPVAAQKVFASLVAEGRRYAETPEGARWAGILGASPVVRRARQLWESSLASVLDESTETILPSEFVEILLQGAKFVAPEELSARMADRTAGVGR